MKQVQTKTSVQDHKQKMDEKIWLRGAVPSKHRTVHDLLCFLVFFALALGFIFCLNIAIIQGKPAQFLYSTGQQFICGHGEAIQYPYAYFYNPLINNKTVCVKKCPQTIGNTSVELLQCHNKFKCRYQAELTRQSSYHEGLNKMKVLGFPTFETVGKLCLPDFAVLENSLQPSQKSIYQKITEQHQTISVIDLYNKYYLIVISTASALILSIVSHVIVRNYGLQKLMIPSFVIASISLFVTFFFFLCQSGTIKGDFLRGIGYLGLAYLQIEQRYLGFALGFLALTILSIIIAAKQIYTFKKSQQNRWGPHSGHLVKCTYKQIVIILTFVVIFLVHWALCIFTFLYLSTSQQNNGDFTKMFVEPVSGWTIQKMLRAYVVFWAIFCSYFIVGLFKTVNALYYSQGSAKEQAKRKNKLFDYWLIVLYHHFGSIVLSNIFLLIGAPLQLLFWSFKTNRNEQSFQNCIQNKKNTDNQQVRPKTLSDRLKNKLNLYKWFCPGALIQIAVRGQNYLTSSRYAYNMLWEILSTRSFQFRNRIQTERIGLASLKTISCILCPLIIHGLFTFNHQLHTTIFQILYILIPSWLISHGLSQIFLNAIQCRTEIQFNNYLNSLKFRPVPKQREEESKQYLNMIKVEQYHEKDK